MADEAAARWILCSSTSQRRWTVDARTDRAIAAQQGDVINGGAASSGTVTVIDTVPAGLTPTAIAGGGWSCDLPSRTCTRSDALAISASYPPITLTVSVDNNAPASVTNTAIVSGGGES